MTSLPFSKVSYSVLFVKTTPVGTTTITFQWTYFYDLLFQPRLSTSRTLKLEIRILYPNFTSFPYCTKPKYKIFLVELISNFYPIFCNRRPLSLFCDFYRFGHLSTTSSVINKVSRFGSVIYLYQIKVPLYPEPQLFLTIGQTWLNNPSYSLSHTTFEWTCQIIYHNTIRLRSVLFDASLNDCPFYIICSEIVP